MPQKVIRVDEGALTLARATLLNKVGERLAPRVENGEVIGFVDQDFIDAFGPGLSKLSDARLTQIALDLLVQHVSHAPTGKTGLKYFDAD